MSIKGQIQKLGKSKKVSKYSSTIVVLIMSCETPFSKSTLTCRNLTYAIKRTTRGRRAIANKRTLRLGEEGTKTMLRRWRKRLESMYKMDMCIFSSSRVINLEKLYQLMNLLVMPSDYSLRWKPPAPS